MIAIGSDHAGYALKCEMIKHLEENGVEFIDCGCNGESVDYPDIAEKTCEKVTSGEADKAILICGTGVGISISANKIKGIRALRRLVFREVHPTAQRRERAVHGRQSYRCRSCG